MKMFGQKKQRRYVFRYRPTPQIQGDYIPEQIVVVDERGRIMHYPFADLFIARYKDIPTGLRKKLRQFLLWLDEHLPDESGSYGEFEFEVEDYDPPDVIWRPTPEDYERLKRGQRKPITQMPSWKVFFPEDK
ncbi:MAG: hypothetical protein SLRJCFUN_002598 [Candidatus Fervidibacter sp.]